MAPPGSGPTLAITPPQAVVGLTLNALRSIDISQVLVGAGTIGSLRIQDIGIGAATVDRLVVQGITAGVHSGSALLQNVRFLLGLKLSVHWWYDVGLWSNSGDQGLGSLILAEVERILGGGRAGFRLSEHFDYIGGTSTGAIVAAGLARGMSVAEIISTIPVAGAQMLEQGASLFERLKYKFTDEPLARKLKEAFGARHGIGLAEP